MNINSIVGLTKNEINGANTGDTVIGNLPQDCILVGFIIRSTAGTPNGDGIFRLECNEHYLASGYGTFNGTNQRVQGFTTDSNAPVYLIPNNAIIPAGEGIIFSVAVADSGSLTVSATAVVMFIND